MPKTAAKKAAAPPPAGIRYDEAGAIATITLARPERLNALTFEMYGELRDRFKWLSTRGEVRAVVLTGEGRGFCSGGDVDQIIRKLLQMSRQELHAFTQMTCDVVAYMRACPQPIVAALNGTVAGAGAALAIASDVRIAVPDAKISFLFTKAGLSGADMGACFLLPRIIGVGRASELLLTGDTLDAPTAERWGLYNRIVPKEKLLEEALKVALKAAGGPSAGIPATKHAIDAELSMGLIEVLARDAKVQAELMEHRDFGEAYEAFKAKRAPKFD